jgi:hypothetical protein
MPWHAGCVVLSLDNYNDASRLIDGNFDGKQSSEHAILDNVYQNKQQATLVGVGAVR